MKKTILSLVISSGIFALSGTAFAATQVNKNTENQITKTEVRTNLRKATTMKSNGSPVNLSKQKKEITPVKSALHKIRPEKHPLRLASKHINGNSLPLKTSYALDKKK